MNRFYCPCAVLKNAFPNLLCAKKIERNKTKLQNPAECFEAMCDHQDLCTCRKQPQNTLDYSACAELCDEQKSAPASEPKKTVKGKKKK